MAEICTRQEDEDIDCAAPPCTDESHEHTVIHEPGCPHPLLMAFGHGISTHQPCPKCGSTNFELRNYDEIWRDGDVHCADCGTYVRMYDAG